MENAAEALKMAFAVFVFIMALSIVFSLVSQIKETADVVLYYSDKTNFYDWEQGDLSEGRIVGAETVIAALYNTSNDLTMITIIDEHGNTIYPSGNSIQDVIKNELDEEGQYKERIVEITTGGTYRIAEDGTRVTVKPGDTKVYIYYTKI